MFPVAGTVRSETSIPHQKLAVTHSGQIIIAVKQRPHINYAFGAIPHVFKTQTLVNRQNIALLYNQTVYLPVNDELHRVVNTRKVLI